MSLVPAPTAAVRRPALAGRRGWAVVTTLSLVLALLVAEQLPGRDASATTTAMTVETAAAVAAPREPDAVDRPFARRELAQPAVVVAAAPAPATAPASAPAAAPPPAPVVGLCTGEGWQQRRGQAALASLRAGAERTGFRVSFSGARKGYLGLTHLHERRIELFVRSCDVQSDALLRHVMAHELGHAYDTTHMTSAKRAAYMAARGIPASTPWYGCSGCTDFATPAGDFAEVYAQWARGGGENRSRMGGTPGPQALAALAAQFFGA
jgi:hypothetical protein